MLYNTALIRIGSVLFSFPLRFFFVPFLFFLIFFFFVIRIFLVINWTVYSQKVLAISELQLYQETLISQRTCDARGEYSKTANISQRCGLEIRDKSRAIDRDGLWRPHAQSSLCWQLPPTQESGPVPDWLGLGLLITYLQA
jgi:hypothetical protein